MAILGMKDLLLLVKSAVVHCCVSYQLRLNAVYVFSYLVLKQRVEFLHAWNMLFRRFRGLLIIRIRRGNF